MNGDDYAKVVKVTPLRRFTLGTISVIVHKTYAASAFEKEYSATVENCGVRICMGDTPVKTINAAKKIWDEKQALFPKAIRQARRIMLANNIPYPLN